MLFEAMLNAPLVGRVPGGDVLHAVDDREIARCWPESDGAPPAAEPTAPCGATGLRLYDAPWPPRVRPLPSDITRCRECQELTGNKRPRSTMRARADA